MNSTERRGKLRLIAGHQYRLNGFEGIQAHPGRTAASKKAIHHLGPQMLVAATGADLSKFAQPALYLATPLPVVASYVLDRYWFVKLLHRFSSILNSSAVCVNGF